MFPEGNPEGDGRRESSCPPRLPPHAQTSLQPPSRREALFGFLGAGVGVAITAGYYNGELREHSLLWGAAMGGALALCLAGHARKQRKRIVLGSAAMGRRSQPRHWGVMVSWRRRGSLGSRWRRWRRRAAYGVWHAGVACVRAATYDLSADSYEKALDALLDNDEFLDSLSDEVRMEGDGQGLG